MPIVFSLWSLRAETTPVETPNDSALHQQMVRWADSQIDRGRVPLDGWYPYMQLGSPQFHQYQTTPHVITAYAGRIVGSESAFRWSTYMFLALWPLSVYAGARLFGAGPWISGASAVLSPLLVSAPGYGFEWGSYLWRGVGVWPQLWGMVVLPPALGLTWRALSEARHIAAAAALVAAAIAFTFIVGYFALVMVLVLALVSAGAWKVRVGRAAAVIVGALLIASWVLAPLLTDRDWVNSSPYFRGEFWNDSFGAEEVLGWLVRGELFDADRFPVVTLMALTGLVACAFAVRTDHRARALLAMTGVSFLLFFGRPTLGPLVNLLPGSQDLMFHRFIIGVHLSGLFLAGTGVVTLVRLGASYLASLKVDARVAYAVPCFALAILLGPAVVERVHFAGENGKWIEDQARADAKDGAAVSSLIEQAKASGHGRVYAGLRNNWGKNYRVGSVPVYSLLASHDVDAIGFTFRTVTGLLTDIEPLFDETDPSHYRLFNVRYLLLPADTLPSVDARLVRQLGGHALYEVDGAGGYADTVDTTDPVEADRFSMSEAMAPLLTSRSFEREGFPLVTFAGSNPGTPTRTEGEASIRETVERESAALENGQLEAQVETTDAAEVLLKTSFHPRWIAWVDGAMVRPRMVAPGFVGVPVTAGRHGVTFRYRPYSLYPLWFFIGLVTLASLVFYPRWAARRSRAS